jgi:1,4-alpha-glucan branching enzyme
METCRFDKIVRSGVRRRASGVAVFVALLAAVGCSSGGPPPGSRFGPELVQGGVIFRYFDRDAKSVYVVGDFNNWSPQADPMIDKNGDGEWTLFYSLASGAYEYKFVVDGDTWIPDPHNPLSNPDGFEGRNSVLRIPEGTSR